MLHGPWIFLPYGKQKTATLRVMEYERLIEIYWYIIILFLRDPG
jgi:hypothetical protein